MAEIEINEQIHQVQHQSHLTGSVGVSTVIFVGLAAIAAMQANFLGEEAVVAQVQAANHWAWYQSKSMKYETQQSSKAILQSLGKPLPASLEQKADKLEQEKENLKAKAEHLEAESKSHLDRHQSFLYSVVFLQVAIALASLASLLERPKLWYTSLGVAVLGTGFMLWGSIPVSHASSVPASVEVKQSVDN